MLKRLIIVLVVAQLLVIAVSTTDIMDRAREFLPVNTQNSQMAVVADDTTEPPSQTDNVPVTGVSSRSTPGHPWAEPVIDGGTVSIPLAVATMGDHIHFEVPGTSGPIQFVAYKLNLLFQIRARVCPNCGGTDIDFSAGKLSCPSCGGAFDPQTGGATSGGQGYPAGTIPVAISDDCLKSPLHSLTVAYERTASGEETLFEGPAVPYPLGCTNC
jgi:nitrite reductase/ring-hydroxylating ferredoxin subunit